MKAYQWSINLFHNCTVYTFNSLFRENIYKSIHFWLVNKPNSKSFIRPDPFPLYLKVTVNNVPRGPFLSPGGQNFLSWLYSKSK